MLDHQLMMVPQPGPTQLKRKRKAENQQRSTSTCKKTIPPRLEQFESYFGHACSVSQHHHHNDNGVSGTSVPPNHRHPLISNYPPQEICLPHICSGEEPTDSESDFSCLDRVNSFGRTSPSLAGSWSNQSAAAIGFLTPDDFDVAPFATQRDSHPVSKTAADTMVGEGPSNRVGEVGGTLSVMACSQRDVAADEWGWFVDAGEDDLRAPAGPSTGNVQRGVYRVAQD